MSRRQFYSQWLRKTFTGPLSLVQLVALFLTIVGGAVAYFVPQWQSFVRIAIWAAPAVVLISAVMPGLLAAPYKIYKEKEQAHDQLAKQLDEIKSAQPQIEYDQSRESPLFHEDQPIYHIIQVWFKNSPTIPSEQSVAKQVSATIEFMNDDRINPRFSVYGQWAISTAPNHVGHAGITPLIDISPGHLSCKLNIALKYEEDSVCYGYAVESFGPYPDGRNPGLELPHGEHPVRVELMGIGVKQDFWFTLRNPGPGGSLELRPLQG